MIYISILRGINVGGKKTIKMDRLRDLYMKLGFNDVKTYIQSGNVVFKFDYVDQNILEEQISKILKVESGFEIPIIVMSFDNLKHIIENNPLNADLHKDFANLYVTFLSVEIEFVNKGKIILKKQPEEEVWFSEKAIYLYCPKGYGKTKLTNNFLEKTLNVVATTRNWKTTSKLFAIAQESVGE